MSGSNLVSSRPDVPLQERYCTFRGGQDATRGTRIGVRFPVREPETTDIDSWEDYGAFFESNKDATKSLELHNVMDFGEKELESLCDFEDDLMIKHVNQETGLKHHNDDDDDNDNDDDDDDHDDDNEDDDDDDVVNRSIRSSSSVDRSLNNSPHMLEQTRQYLDFLVDRPESNDEYLVSDTQQDQDLMREGQPILLSSTSGSSLRFTRYGSFDPGAHPSHINPHSSCVSDLRVTNSSSRCLSTFSAPFVSAPTYVMSSWSTGGQRRPRPIPSTINYFRSPVSAATAHHLNPDGRVEPDTWERCLPAPPLSTDRQERNTGTSRQPKQVRILSTRGLK